MTRKHLNSRFMKHLLTPGLTFILCMLATPLSGQTPTKGATTDATTDAPKDAPTSPITVNPEGEAADLTWTYTFKFDKTEEAVRIVLPIATGVSLEVVDFKNARPLYTQIEAKRREYSFKAINKTEGLELKFRVSGDTTRFRSSKMTIGYAVGTSALSFSEVDAPAPLPSRVRMMFGVGASVRADDFIDYKLSEDSNTLFVDLDSRARAEGYLGALFELKRFKKDKRLDALVSLQFGEGDRGALTGFLFGFGYQINPSLSIVGGYSLRRGEELSPGFVLAAEDFIREQQAADNPNFRRFDLNNVKARFDGLSLVRPGTMDRIFPGNPIISSFNTGFSIGIAIPLDVMRVFRDQN